MHEVIEIPTSSIIAPSAKVILQYLQKYKYNEWVLHRVLHTV